MNRRMMIILLSAFVIASMSAFLVWRMVGARISAARPIATTKVVAAAKEIKIGTVLDASDLTTIQLVGSAPTGAILDVKNAIGRGAISQIYSGEPILENRLAPKGSGGGLAATIKEGMRACAVKVDEVVGVAGFATPGMRVDVLVSGVPPNSQNTQNSQVRTILQNIEVLSAGTDIQKDAEGKPQQVQVVNLLVTPEQAQILSLAATQMRIQLVLRNPLDTKISVVPDTAMTSLFGQPAQPANPAARRAAKPKPAPFTVQVINGSKVSEQKFASTGGQQ
ncbi:MAG: Flp pilus assembly protein CpaB [Acidobacteriota bacterium]|nr:Flp pilus assembly protein CpaB [Acidobacteriota bacterium]MDE3162443.1 Flp pilus assembly protein CpaB [Acidobacteriota bacterium]